MIVIVDYERLWTKGHNVAFSEDVSRWAILPAGDVTIIGTTQVMNISEEATGHAVAGLSGDMVVVPHYTQV